MGLLLFSLIFRRYSRGLHVAMSSFGLRAIFEVTLYLKEACMRHEMSVIAVDVLPFRSL